MSVLMGKLLRPRVAYQSAAAFHQNYPNYFAADKLSDRHHTKVKISRHHEEAIHAAEQIQSENRRRNQGVKEEDLKKLMHKSTDPDSETKELFEHPENMTDSEQIVKAERYTKP